MLDGLKEKHNAMKKGRAYKNIHASMEKKPSDTNGISPNNRKGE
jgi:hypothetical protein